MKYLFLAILIVSSVIHLYHSYKDEMKKRPYTKWILLLAILGYYLTSVSVPSKFLIAALITSWLGDVLLIPQGMAWFVAGGISFLASHILFITVYVPNVAFDNVTWWAVAIVAAIYLAVAAFVIKTLLPTTSKSMVAPLFLYITANATMNVFAFMQLISNPCPASAIAYAGAILFFISDCSLFCVKFHKNRDLIFKRHFTVMLTYILGEFLITQGVLMLTK